MLLNILSIILLGTVVSAQEQAVQHLWIKQGDESILIDQAEQSITLKKDAFSIQFWNKAYQPKKNQFYAAQAVIISQDIQDHFEGLSTDEVPYLASGTGFAAESNQNLSYPFYSNEGHQYLYYTSEKDRRIDKVKKHNNGNIYNWTIKGLWMDEEDYDWKTIVTESIHLLFFIDSNQNDVMDKGEYFIIHIAFE